jgi:hypothetical protein
VRIVESFLTRRHPGVVYGDPTDTVSSIMPGIGIQGEQWNPGMGAEPLHRSFREFLRKQYNNDIAALNKAWGRENSSQYSHFEQIMLPPVRPAGANEAEVKDWRRFLAAGIGFTYTPVELPEKDPAHRLAYRKFLARRYQRVDRLNQAYQWTAAADKLSSFDKVQLPEVFPGAGQPLTDWVQFVSQVLAIKERAHRFTVLVPMDPAIGTEARQQRLDLVKRIVQIEKPAHTYGEVKPYWALFRVGEARLGLDTVPGLGSRCTALILGKNTLADSYLGAGHPWEVKDRWVLGRDK